MKHVHFYIVPDRLKPILGVGDALALDLTSFHFPVYEDWQSNCNLTNSVDSIHSNANSTVHTGTGTGIVNSTHQEFTMGTLTKLAIINHPKYAHLFPGIGYFTSSEASKKGSDYHERQIQTRIGFNGSPRYNL